MDINNMGFVRKCMLLAMAFVVAGGGSAVAEEFDRTGYKAIVGSWNTTYEGVNHYYYKAMGNTSAFTSTDVVVFNNKVYCSDDVARTIAWTVTDESGGTVIMTQGDEPYLCGVYSTSPSKMSLAFKSSSFKSMTNYYCYWNILADGIYSTKTQGSYFIGYNSSFGCYNNSTITKAILYDFATDNSYTRSGLTANQLGTICIPFPVGSTEGSGAVFYRIAGKKLDGEGNPTNLVLEEVESLEVNKPYIFQVTGTSFTLEMDEIPNGTVFREDNNDSKGLYGSFVQTDVAEGKYVISGNEVVKCGTGCSIGAYRAYVDMANVPEYVEGAGSSKAMVLRLGGAVASVGEVGAVDDGRGRKSDRVYNVYGQRVRSMGRGIVVVNGKKVVR